MHLPDVCQVDQVEFTAGLSSHIHLTEYILLHLYYYYYYYLNTLTSLKGFLAARNSNIDVMRYA